MNGLCGAADTDTRSKVDRLRKELERQNRDVLKHYRTWKEDNGLSARQVAELLTRAGFSTSRRTVESWEATRSPSLLALMALELFMAEHPRVTDPPVYEQTQKVKPLSPEIISEIHRLRAQDVEMAKIAETLGVSKSAVSRILAGKRRRKDGHPN